MTVQSPHVVVGVFPIPIWQRIITHLGPQGVVVSLLCQALREPSRCVIFRHLTFTGLPFGASLTKKTKKPWLARSAGLRDFRASPIKNYVRSIEIVEWSSGHPQPLVWECGEALFELIAELPNLIYAECTNILFKGASFQAITARKTPLESVVFRNCTFQYDETVTYNVKDVHVIGPSNLTGFAAENFAYAVSALLVPTTLRRLRLETPDTIAQILALNTTKPKFSSLELVELSLAQACPPLLEFFGRCPSLQQVNLRITDVMASVLPEGLEPYVRIAPKVNIVGLE